MTARRLIEGSTYGPQALTVLKQAFDEAWFSIGHHFSSEPEQQEAARLQLAHAVLAVAKDDGPTVEEVREAAIQVMTLSYPNHLGASHKS